MKAFILQIAVLIGVYAAGVIDNCESPEAQGSTLNMVLRYQRHLLSQLALDSDHSVLLLKAEEAGHSGFKKALFQVMNSSFESYYLGLSFESIGDNFRFDVFIQSPKLDLVLSALGLAKYERSIVCDNFKAEAKNALRKELNLLHSSLIQEKKAEGKLQAHHINPKFMKAGGLKIEKRPTEIINGEENRKLDKKENDLPEKKEKFEEKNKKDEKIQTNDKKEEKKTNEEKTDAKILNSNEQNKNLPANKISEIIKGNSSEAKNEGSKNASTVSQISKKDENRNQISEKSKSKNQDKEQENDLNKDKDLQESFPVKLNKDFTQEIFDRIEKPKEVHVIHKNNQMVPDIQIHLPVNSELKATAPSPSDQGQIK